MGHKRKSLEKKDDDAHDTQALLTDETEPKITVNDPNSNQNKRAPLKRRKRVTVVCNVCKYRKVRCDRGKPCKSCVRYNTGHICDYDGPVWTDEEAMEKLSQTVEQSGKSSTNKNQQSTDNELVANSLDENDEAYIRESNSAFLGNTNNTNNKDEPEKKERAQLPRSESHKPYHRSDSNNHSGQVTLLTSRLTDLLCSFGNFESVLGVNPITTSHEKINFYENYTSISVDSFLSECVNHGPFSWRSYIQKDCGLADLWNCIHERRKINKDLSGNTNTPYSVLQRIRAYLLSEFDPKRYAGQFNKLPLGLTFNESISNKDITLPERIQLILPVKNIIWCHIDQFFRFVYPFYPFIDESQFRRTISSIIGPEVYDEVNKATVVIKEKIDFAFLGLLLLVMRLSYLSLISNKREVNEINIKSSNSNKNDNEVSTLLVNPIGIEFADLARSCLNEFQLFHRTSLEVLQLALFMKLYMFSAPENPEGPFKNQFQIYNGVLIQMGYSIGLNREPDNFPDILNDCKINNVRRKIWYHLSHMDINHSVAFGSPYLTSERFVDTKFPFSDSNNSNCMTENMDTLIVASMKPLSYIMPLVREILKLVLDVRTKISMSELTEKISEIETSVFHEYGTLEDLAKTFENSSSDDNLIKGLQLQHYLTFKFFLLSIYFHFFLHYESREENKLAFFYLKKILSLCVEECLPFYYDLIDKPHKYFKESIHVWLNSYVQISLHRSNLVFFLFISRLAHTVTNLESNDAKESTLERYKYFLKLLVRCLKLSITGVSKLSHRDCSAWRIAKSHTYLLRTLLSEEFQKPAEAEYNRAQTINLKFTDQELADLISYVEKPLKKIDLKKATKEWELVKDTVDPEKSSLFYEKLPELGDINGSYMNEYKKSSVISSKQISENPNKKLHVQGKTLSDAVDNSILSDNNSIWLGDLNIQEDLNTAMKSYFDLQDPFLDVFNDFPLTQAFEGLGND